MKLLLDLNIWIDIALRPNEFPESIQLFKKAAAADHDLCLPSCGYTTLYYILTQALNRAAAKEFLVSLDTDVIILPFGSSDVIAARQLKFDNFEDAFIAATAFSNRCDHIITRNEKDYRSSPIPAMHPAQGLKKLLL